MTPKKTQTNMTDKSDVCFGLVVQQTVAAFKNLAHKIKRK